MVLPISKLPSAVTVVVPDAMTPPVLVFINVIVAPPAQVDVLLNTSAVDRVMSHKASTDTWIAPLHEHD